MADTPHDQQQELQILLDEKEALLKQNQHQKGYHTFKKYLKLKKKLGLTLHKQQFIEACELCNLISMRGLKSNQYSMAVDYLKEASHYSKVSNYMLLVTHSNWGCYYKKVHNYEQALENSLKALTLAKKLDETDLKCENKNYFIADCHLNICAILSSMKKHQQALEHVQSACAMLDEQSKDKNRKQVYWIGYFNLAVEYQHLKRYQESLTTYLKLRGIILNSTEQNVSLLAMVNDAIIALQKIVIPKKTHMHKSSSLDPFHKYPKSSCHNLLDDRKSQLQISHQHNSSSYPIRSTEVSRLPVLTDTQNTTKTLQILKKSMKRFKLQNINIKSTTSNLTKICPTDRIIVNKKKLRRVNRENIKPQPEL